MKSHAIALEAANETFNDCLFCQLKKGMAVEDSDDLSSYSPAVSDSELAAAIANIRMPADEYMACVRIAADEANWIYDCVCKHELSRLKLFN